MLLAGRLTWSMVDRWRQRNWIVRYVATPLMFYASLCLVCIFWDDPKWLVGFLPLAWLELLVLFSVFPYVVRLAILVNEQ